MVPFLLLLVLASAQNPVVQFANDFSLSWLISGDTIEFTIVCGVYGYCSFGFGRDMTDVDMIAALKFSSNSNVILWDLWSTGDDTPPNDTTFGGTNDLTLISSTDTGSGFTTVFSRKLNTGDKYDFKIVQDLDTEMVWALKSAGSFTEHNSGDYGAVSFKLTNIAADVVVTEIDTGYGDEFHDHGSAMQIAWAIAAPGAIWVARYLRWFPWWAVVHTLVTGAVGIVTLFSCISIYQENEFFYTGTGDADKIDHSRIGLALASLVIAEMSLGALSFLFMWCGKSIYQMSVVRKAHKIIGYSLVVIGYVNVLIGRDIMGEGTAGYIVIGIGYALLFLISEIRTYFSKYFKPSKIDCRRKPKKKYDYTEVLKKAARGKPLFFCDEYVLNLKWFMKMHPGGMFVLQAAIGEDLGKYLHGCSGYGDGYFPYDHSNMAKDMVQQCAKGKVKTPKGIIVKREGGTSKKKMHWTVSQRNPVAKDTYQLVLTSNKFQVGQDVQLDWLGKHYLITHENMLQDVSRYYSALFTPMKELEVQNNQTDQTAGEDYLQVIFKYYPQGKLTSYLAAVSLNSQIQLKGPLGPGLALNSEFQGHTLGLAAGTGLVPFIDLAVLIVKNESGQSAVAQGISLTLFVAFASRQFAFCLDRLEQLAYNSQRFKIRVSISDDANSKRIDREMLGEFLAENPLRAWCCGPSGFNRFIANMMDEAKYPREQLMLL